MRKEFFERFKNPWFCVLPLVELALMILMRWPDGALIPSPGHQKKVGTGVRFLLPLWSFVSLFLLSTKAEQNYKEQTHELCFFQSLKVKLYKYQKLIKLTVWYLVILDPGRKIDFCWTELNYIFILIDTSRLCFYLSSKSNSYLALILETRLLNFCSDAILALYWWTNTLSGGNIGPKDLIGILHHFFN